MSLSLSLSLSVCVCVCYLGTSVQTNKKKTVFGWLVTQQATATSLITDDGVLVEDFLLAWKCRERYRRYKRQLVLLVAGVFLLGLLLPCQQLL